MAAEKLYYIMDHIPEKVKYIFKDPIKKLSPEDYKYLIKLEKRAKDLAVEKDCQDHYPKEIDTTVYWLKFAYEYSRLVKERIYDDTVEKLADFIDFAKEYGKV